MDVPLEDEHVSSIGRREMLRRGAALGAAMAVATPAVQALGRVSAFAETSPPPPPPPPPPNGFTGISYVGLVFTCSGVLWRAKWEADGTKWVDVTTTGQWDSLPQCPAPAGWTTATGVPGPGFNAVPNKPGVIQVAPTYLGGELYSVTFTLPNSCTFQDGSGVAKGGNPDNVNSGGYCATGTGSGQTITYTAA